ncbi:hypothetical protein SAMN04488515_1679 [Cognatiyoonia koreensis]|uniref:Repeat domain-containing protein n=1 Tax=Cognatiyoonia koreensis TaxID=364200 RepID=A0A1I0Q5N6_9RHOB|nr:VCBS repeat-containing protein [Cognatiyoonia koreensis]SEW22122.1 hypothetical protein SAMN04488515_1679 [Cognatiyoonia koreensis]
MRIALAISLTAMAGPISACAIFPEPDPLLGATYNADGTEALVWYADPSDAYQHGVLGDAIEGTRIRLRSSRTWNTCGVFFAWAGEDHVYEDTAPRLADMDGDGVAEVIAVRSSVSKGAQLIVYAEPNDPMENGFPDMMSVVAATPYIGTANRWLAPIGAADLDGDGTIEIAYVDRPHLAKTLRIVSIQGDQLLEEAALPGVTNHRIGERDIAGGVRDCGQGPEMIVASADWSQLLAVTYDGSFQTRQIGTDTSRSAFVAAIACQ